MLLGLAIAVIPSLPLVVLYVPLRVARARDAKVLREMSRIADRQEFERFLAQRALHHLPYRKLRRVCAQPWSATPEQRRLLAAAELERVGLRPAVAGDER